MLQKAMLVGAPLHVSMKIESALTKGNFEIQRFAHATQAVPMTEMVPFHMIIAAYPLPDMPVQDFLFSVRKPGSPCLHTPVLLLAYPGKEKEAEEYIGYGANRVLPINTQTALLTNEITGLLQVAPRISQRILVRINAEVEKRKQMILSQTENISMSGMLLHTGRRLPVGTDVKLEFMIPADRIPLRIEGKVVRHTMVGKEKAIGMAVRFTGFEEAQEQRLSEYLNRKLK